MKTRYMGNNLKKSPLKKNFSQKEIEKFVIIMKAVEVFVVIIVTIGGLFYR
jgi:hypothetical protein